MVSNGDDNLDSFLSKVDKVTDLIHQLKDADSSRTDEVLGEADRAIEVLDNQDGVIGVDRTVINESASEFPCPNVQEVPNGNTMNQASFMASMEQDALERAKRRKQRATDALIPKEKGNAAFKNGDYEQAISCYLEAIRIDPGTALLYTNCAQAYIKLGKFEEAAERCSIAIRADEKCVKGYLRLGIAKSALGQYDEAREAFQQAKILSPKKQHPIFDKHLEDTKLAEEILCREQKLLAEQGSSSHSKFQAIDRGCAVLASSKLDAKIISSVFLELKESLSDVNHQDMFRLRKGTRLLSLPVVVAFIKDVGRSDVSKEVVTVIFALLKLAIRDNEASRRDVFSSIEELRLCFEVIAHGSESLRLDTLSLLVEACRSSRVRELASSLNAETGCFTALITMVEADHSNAEVGLLLDVATSLAQESIFRSILESRFMTNLFPKLAQLLRNGGAAATASINFLLQLSADVKFRKILARPAVVIDLQSILSATINFAELSSERMLLICNFLGLFTNLSLEESALTICQSREFTSDCILKMLSKKPIVFIRAATLICRLCTSDAYANDLIQFGVLNRLIIFTPPTELIQDFNDVFARILIKCTKLSQIWRDSCEKKDVVSLLVPMLKGPHTKTIGNVALAIAELSTSRVVCSKLGSSTVVADLMTHARKERGPITENCAVALARLAAGDVVHLARLKQLKGLEVIHSRAGFKAA